MVILLLFVSYLFGNIATIGSPAMLVYGGFIFLFVYALTELMDGNRYAIVWEIAKALLSIGILYKTGDWFGSNTWLVWIRYALPAYFVLSVAITGWFVFKNNSSQKTAALSI